MVAPIDPNSKADFQARVKKLLMNPAAVEKIEVYHPKGATGREELFTTLQNTPQTQGSLQIWANITDNNGFIFPAAAREGLSVYGQEYIDEAHKFRDKHPNILLLECIAEGGRPFRANIGRRYAAKPIPEHVRAMMPIIARELETPIHVYDEQGIRQTCRDLKNAFSWVPGGYKNFFAVKACPNPRILELLIEEGMGADCSSGSELVLARAAGFGPGEIMFTSNNTPDHEFQMAHTLDAIQNYDDITHIAAFKRAVGKLPESVFLRYGPGEECQGNSIIGVTDERKYGMTREQLFEAVDILLKEGVKSYSLHTMMASNERDVDKLIDQARLMLGLSRDLKHRFGKGPDSLNLGGGIGTAYRPEQRNVNLSELGEGIKNAYFEMLPEDLRPRIFTECGRVVTGPHGWLLTQVLHVMKKHRDYIGVDATMADLMRPGMYGAYHHLTVLGKETAPSAGFFDVVGSLCENCDKFAIQRAMPLVERGDLIAVHNSGAHGRAMCFNYNGKLRSGEALVNPGVYERIRRRESFGDIFATFDFPGSRFEGIN